MTFSPQPSLRDLHADRESPPPGPHPTRQRCTHLHTLLLLITIFGVLWTISAAERNRLMHAMNGNISKQLRQDTIVATLVEAGYQQGDRLYRALLQKLGDEEVSALASRPAGPPRTAAIVAAASRLGILDQGNVRPQESAPSAGWTMPKRRRPPTATRQTPPGQPSDRRQPPPGQPSQPPGKPNARRPPNQRDPNGRTERPPLKLRPEDWDVPIADDGLARGGTGVAYVTSKDDATALAQAVSGGGGRLAIVTVDPIRRPDPDGWDQPDGDTYPSTCARVVFTAGADSIRPLKRHITQLGADPVTYTMRTDDGPAAEPADVAAGLLFEVCEGMAPKDLTKRIETDEG
eukprot:gene14223-15030_t